MKLYLSLQLLLTTSLFYAVTVHSQDIDLYVNQNINLDEKPRVLLIFDTSASMNFSTNTGEDCGYIGGWILCPDNRLNVAQAAMKDLITSNTDVDFGLMRFNALEGGYVLNGIGAEPQAIKDSIDDLNADGGTPLTETLWEAYLYITGQNLDFALNINRSNRDASIENQIKEGGWVRKCYWWGCIREWGLVDRYSYISPFADSVAEAKRCDNSVNIIYMTDGDPTKNDDNQRDNQISQLNHDYFNRYLNYSTDSLHGSYLHQLARIMHGNKQTKIDLYPQTPDIHETARLFTIGFGSGMTNEGKALLSSAAANGGGDDYFVDKADELSDALTRSISAIREETSTFTSPSFASNNVDQTRSRDAIYLTMFYPEVDTRWRGNLKKLKVSNGKIIDSSLKPALNSDGLIDSDAKTFWSINNLADGNSVKKGGVNAALSSRTISREIYTQINNQGLIPFEYESIRRAYGDEQRAANEFGVPVSEFKNTIDWARGNDVDAENPAASTRNDIFGDPLHSKPIAINYGNNDIRLLIGTNAGFLHMFKDDDEKNTVQESWAFIPSALYNIIKPQRNRVTGKAYGMDGPISVYAKNESLDNNRVNDGIVDASKGDKVWAFAGMRRGGKNYYGFDITTPDSPKLKWSIIGGEGEFTQLGQTWSKPQVAFIKAFGDKPVLVFGGGYDTNKDSSFTADATGNNVYIVDADSGTKLWSLLDNNNFAGKHSIAADVTLLDSDYDGYIDRIYAADTGGNIWRIDMPSNKEATFNHHKLAELGASVDRRFFYKPLVARTMFSKVTIKGETTTRLDTPFDAIVIGSGKRTSPNDTETSDQLFMIRDENTVTQSFTNKPSAIQLSDLMVMNNDPFGNALDDVDGFIELEATLSKFKGWRYNLARGEKSLAAATVVGGVAYFTSFTPASDSATKNQCSLSGGGGSLYAFHLHYGTKVYDDLKFTTSTEVPDTPQLYFGSTCQDSDNNGQCDSDDSKVPQSQFYIIGPGIKGDSSKNPLKPVEISGPELTVVDGKIQLTNEKSLGFGFKTQQTYIYKREDNDGTNN